MATERTLPKRPNLEQLRNQARELQRSLEIPLSEAQRRLAREYGFTSWPALKHQVEELLGIRQHLDTFVEHALGGRLEKADRLLSEHPELRGTSAAAALLGDVPAGAELDPTAALPPKDWEPLLYVCFSRYQDREPERTHLTECARDLLSRGADANAHYWDGSYPELPETCLYGAVGRANNLVLTRLLLEHGANPQDCEAIYHGTEHQDTAALRLVLEAGGDPRDCNAIARVLDYNNLAGLRLVLEHYPHRDDYLSGCIHHAIIRGRSPEHLQMLIEHGADPSFRRDGVTAYVRARLYGRKDLAEAIENAGGDSAMSPEERYLIACVEGDDSVRPVEVPRELQWPLADAAGRNDVAAMRRMLEAGFDPDVTSGWGQTALHQAGWNGHREAVELLLDHGASLAVKDPHHDGTPLNFTVAGAAWGANASGDHVGAARAMLEHGGKQYCSPEWIYQLSEDLPEIRTLLESYGIGAK